MAAIGRGNLQGDSAITTLRPCDLTAKGGPGLALAACGHGGGRQAAPAAGARIATPLPLFKSCPTPIACQGQLTGQRLTLGAQDAHGAQGRHEGDQKKPRGSHRRHRCCGAGGLARKGGGLRGLMIKGVASPPGARGRCKARFWTVELLQVEKGFSVSRPEGVRSLTRDPPAAALGRIARWEGWARGKTPTTRECLLYLRAAFCSASRAIVGLAKLCPRRQSADVR